MEIVKKWSHWMLLLSLQMFHSQKLRFSCDYIENNNFYTCILRRYLKELLLQCIINVEFRLRNDFYRQTDGIVMGLPLAYLVVQYFMVNLENTVLRPIIERFHLY